MNTRKPSASFITFVLILGLSVTAVIPVIFSSCGRIKRDEAVRLEPPPLHPAPPKPPSMVGKDTIWDTVDKKPLFPGGDELLVRYISKNIRYPEDAKAKGIKGRVVVKFCISQKGDVSGYQITTSVSPELDAEALRVVKTMTKFEPARVDGKPVTSWYYLPITFSFK